MKDEMQVSLDGDVRLMRKFAKLAGPMQATVVKRSLRSASKVVLRAVKENAKSMVGGHMGDLIARTAKVYTNKRRRGDPVYGMRVAPKPDVHEFEHETADGERYYIPWAIEYGHAFPGRGGGASPPKDVQPIPYARNAYEKTKDESTRVFWQSMSAQVKAIWNA